MSYKALICDFDGTLVPYQEFGIPSKRVLLALKEAGKFMYVGIATGRPLFRLNYVLPYLPLTSYCIVNGGAQIYNPLENKVIREYPLNRNDLEKLRGIVQSKKAELILNNGKKDFMVNKRIPENILSGIIRNLTEFQADSIIEQNSSIPSIALHKTPFWKKGFYEVNVNNVLATKQHGISEIAKALNIQTHEIISIGDGYNDFPLLMACGLRIAMGNAFEDLKTIAHYVAPTVDEDGVAEAINKFILPRSFRI